MKRWVLYLPPVLLLLLALPSCGQIPTPEPGQAGSPLSHPPPTPAGEPPPTPRETVDSSGWRPEVDITLPIRHMQCTPTPSDAERAAVEALGLPANMDFNLRRAVYLARQQGIPWRPAKIGIRYDPGVVTITETVSLAERYGIEVTDQLDFSHSIAGYAALDVVSQLAMEPGIVEMWLSSGTPLYDDFRCPTPGGPTPAPVTPSGWSGP